jgi:hypothetical protein
VPAKVPRQGVPTITRDRIEKGQSRPTSLYAESGMAKLVPRIRDTAELPATFTLDARRHADRRSGRAFSAHKSRAYEEYAKRTMERARAATRKRHAHMMATANAARTEFQK